MSGLTQLWAEIRDAGRRVGALERQNAKTPLRTPPRSETYGYTPFYWDSNNIWMMKKSSVRRMNNRGVILAEFSITAETSYAIRNNADLGGGVNPSGVNYVKPMAQVACCDGTYLWCTDSTTSPTLLECYNASGTKTCTMAMPTGVIADVDSGYIWLAIQSSKTLKCYRYDGTLMGSAVVPLTAYPTAHYAAYHGKMYIQGPIVVGGYTQYRLWGYSPAITQLFLVYSVYNLLCQNGVIWVAYTAGGSVSALDPDSGQACDNGFSYWYAGSYFLPSPNDTNNVFATSYPPPVKGFFLEQYGNYVSVVSCSKSGTTITIVTATPHGCALGSSGFYITGAVPTDYNGQYNLPTGGAVSFPDDHTIALTATAYAVATASNAGIKLWRCGYGVMTLSGVTGSGGKATATSSSPHGFTTTYQSVASATFFAGLVTITTTVPHGYTAGDYVFIDGAVQSAYNGVFSITILDASRFSYAIGTSPTTPATGTITAGRSTPQQISIGAFDQTQYNGIATIRVTGLSTFEYLYPTAGSPASPGTGNNTYMGAYMTAADAALTVGAYSGDYVWKHDLPNWIQVVTITNSGGVATVTTNGPHGGITGTVWRIAGCTWTDKAYNGRHTITVTGANTFTFALSGTASSPAQGSPSVISSLTSIAGLISGSLCTAVTTTPHGFATNDYINISGANEPEYNGLQSIYVVDAYTFVYAVQYLGFASPATGSPLTYKYSIMTARTYCNFTVFNAVGVVVGRFRHDGWITSGIMKPYYWDTAYGGIMFGYDGNRIYLYDHTGALILKKRI